MKRLPLVGALAFAAVSAAATSSYAAHSTALSAVASSLGYNYSYLGPEDAVALTRPGVTVVIRPGESLFDVNDRTEAMDGTAPYFSRSDIFVSDALVKRLREIAARYPLAAEVSTSASANRLENSADAAHAVTGSISGLAAVQTPGSDTVTVHGKAPANSPITLTLVGTMSKDIPDVVLSRHRVLANASGNFSTIVSVAPGNFAGAIFKVVASSLPGVTPASAQVSIAAPNAKVAVPADDLP